MTDRELAQLYEIGYTLAELARMTGQSATTVWLKTRRGRRQPCPHELADSLQRWGVEGCAEEYGVGVATIKYWMREDTPHAT